MIGSQLNKSTDNVLSHFFTLLKNRFPKEDFPSLKYEIQKFPPKSFSVVFYFAWDEVREYSVRILYKDTLYHLDSGTYPGPLDEEIYYEELIDDLSSEIQDLKEQSAGHLGKLIANTLKKKVVESLKNTPLFPTLRHYLLPDPLPLNYSFRKLVSFVEQDPDLVPHVCEAIAEFLEREETA